MVTVTYNAGEAFATTLASVRAQTWRDRVEYLVVDGVSTDGTVDAVARAAKERLVDHFVSEPDGGIYDAMNKAVSYARGTYVLFLNAGDVFPESDTVERFLSGADSVGFLWGDSEVDRDGTILPDPAGRMSRFLYRQMTVCHQSLAVRTELLKSHPFDLGWRVAADYAVLCALVTEGVSGQFRPVVVSRVQDEGFSSRHFFRGLEEKRVISRRYFPKERWRSEPYFWLWGTYMKAKMLLKERT